MADMVHRYYRSSDGGTVHQAGCSRLTRKSVYWMYAEGCSPEDVRAEVGQYGWLRLCSTCWPPAQGGESRG